MDVETEEVKIEKIVERINSMDLLKKFQDYIEKMN